MTLQENQMTGVVSGHCRASVWRPLADFGKAVADYEESLKINPKIAVA